MIIAALLALKLMATPRYGYASLDTEGARCMQFDGANLKAGERLTVVAWEHEKPVLLHGRVLRKSAEPCFNEMQDTGGTSYAIEVDGKPPGNGELALVVIPEPPPDVTFRHCASMEGLHFTA